MENVPQNKFVTEHLRGYNKIFDSTSSSSLIFMATECGQSFHTKKRETVENVSKKLHCFFKNHQLKCGSIFILQN